MDLRESLLKWIQQQGYPLELRVGGIFRDLGYRVAHSQWYTDPETSKTRESDVVASLFPKQGVSPLGEDLGLAITFVVECKTSPDKPWVVFSSPQSSIPPLQLRSAAVDGLSRALLYAASIHKIDIPQALQAWRVLGQSLTRAHAKNDPADPTTPYAGLRAVVTASMALAREAAESTFSLGAEMPRMTLFVPLLVVDAPLFMYQIEDGSERLTSVDSAAVAMPGRWRDDFVAVRVVRKEAFAAFADLATQELGRFLVDMRPVVGGVVGSFCERASGQGIDGALGAA